MAAQTAEQAQISEIKKQRSEERESKNTREAKPEFVETALSDGIFFGRKISGQSPITSMSLLLEKVLALFLRDLFLKPHTVSLREKNQAKSTIF